MLRRKRDEREYISHNVRSGHNVSVWLLEASTHWPLCVKRLLERSKFISMGCRTHEGTLSIIFSFPFLHGSLLLFSAFIFPSGMWTFFLYLSLLSFSRSSQLPISFFHQIISHAHTHATHTHTHTHSCWFLWFTGTFHRRNGFYTVQAVCAIALHLPYT